MDSFESLLGKAKRGAREALAKLLREEQSSVQNALAGKIPDDLQSVLGIEDVVQETLVEAFHDIAELRGDDRRTFQAWLKTMAEHNLSDAIGALRAEKRGGKHTNIGPVFVEDTHAHLYELLTGSLASPSSELARQEHKHLLEHAIAQLPKSYRQVVFRYDLEQRSADEVAEALGITQGALFMKRKRAHKLLRRLLGTSSEFF